jgi:hypothetical protein
MNKILFSLILFSTISLRAQFLPTDSLNFGEDSTSHSYAKYGNVTVGTYSCGTNKSIRIGNGTGADSVVFNLAVTPGTDSVKLEIVMPWHGGTQNPKIWVENFRNDTVPYMGVGNCTPVFIKMGGLSSRTNDGLIKVKLMDTLSGFSMDGQFTYIKVYSKYLNVTSISERRENQAQLHLFPNPSPGIFYLSKASSDPIHVYNVSGMLVLASENSAILDLRELPQGIYLVKTGPFTQRVVKTGE